MTCLRIGSLIGLLCAMLSFGQEAKNRPAPDSDHTVNPPSLRIDVDLVLVHATVTDSANRYVTGLKPEHFRLWEDKIEQPIEYFSSENLPLSVGIVFDISGSMENKLMPARAAANTFLRTGDRDDEYFLIQFSDEPQLIQDFTTDTARLLSRLLFTRAKGSTSLYDALYLGLAKVTRGSNARKALLVITDGEDNHSRYSLSEVREFAKEHDVSIYTIGIMNQQDILGLEYISRRILENLSNLTGGIAFFPRSVDTLDAICAQIGIDLKSQYVLGYRSLNLSNDGKWRKIRIKINTPKGMPSLSVRAKNGYYASAAAKAMK